jgi:hypothetical protein
LAIVIGVVWVWMRRRSAPKRRSEEEVLGRSELDHEPKYSEMEHKPLYSELEQQPKYSGLEHQDQKRDNIPDGVEHRHELGDGMDLVEADNGQLTEMNAMPGSRDGASSEREALRANTIHQH